MRKRIQTYKIFESESGQYFRIQHREWMLGTMLPIDNRIYDILYDMILPNRSGEFSDITTNDYEITHDRYCIIISVSKTEEIHIREKADEWYYVARYQAFDDDWCPDDDWDKCEYFKCDQIEGVIRLLKEEGIV